MRRIVVTQPAALEAGLARFDAWWHERAPRERVLLIVMAVLIAAVVLVFGIVKPLQAARASALADIRSYETATARLRAIGAPQPGAAAPGQPPAPSARRRTGTPEGVITAAGTGFGLAPAIQQVPGGHRVTLTDAPYDKLVSFVGDLAATSPYRVTRASLTRG